MATTVMSFSRSKQYNTQRVGDSIDYTTDVAPVFPQNAKVTSVEVYIARGLSSATTSARTTEVSIDFECDGDWCEVWEGEIWLGGNGGDGTAAFQTITIPSSYQEKFAKHGVDAIRINQAGSFAIRGHSDGYGTATFTYEIMYTLCYWGDSARCQLSSEYSVSTATLSWSGAVAGTNNPVGGYYVYYADVTNPNSHPDESEWIEYKSTTGTSLEVPAPDNQNVYRLFSVWVGGTNYYDFDSGWLDCETFLRKGHEQIDGFTDPVLTPGTSYIKALHMTELQDRVNTLRTFYGLNAYTFSTINPGTTSLANWSSHVNEIRTAIDQLCTKSGNTHDTWISIPVNCPRVDVMQQLRDIILAM